MTDVLAGQIPLLFTPVAATIPYLKTGKLKGLAITTAARHPLVPDLRKISAAGKHVIVEKPLANNLTAAVEMTTAAERAGVVIEALRLCPRTFSTVKQWPR